VNRFIAVHESRARLNAAVEALEPDAIELLAYIAERLVAGRAVYGDLDLDTDPRHWHREVLAEDADGLVYRAAAAVCALRKTKGQHPPPSVDDSIQPRHTRGRK